MPALTYCAWPTPASHTDTCAGTDHACPTDVRNDHAKVGRGRLKERQHAQRKGQGSSYLRSSTRVDGRKGARLLRAL